MKALLIVLMSSLFVQVTSQENNGEEYYDDAPGVIVGTGFSLYQGGFNNSGDINFLKSSRGNLQIEYFHPITHALIIKAGFLKTKFNYWDANSIDVRAKMSSFNLSANYRFDNGKVIKKKLGYSPYVGMGVGYFSMNVHADYLSEGGENYFYWSDGTIRNMDEQTSTGAEADTIYRDYNFETNVTDSLNVKSGLQSFIEVGIGMKFTPNLTGQISYKYMLLFNDAMQGVSKVGTNDKYGYLSVGLGFNFGGIKKSKDQRDVIEQSNTLGSLDEDKDGIVDLYDKCAHSSSKAKVDKNGCPLDSDKDGIADFEDVEPKSPHTNVNEKGRAYTDEELEVIYLLKSGVISGHEKYAEFKKKYDSLFKKFSQDTETLEHHSESEKE